jgi:excisionase family DNA binding protein
MVERLLTLEEVADMLRLPVATIYRQRYVGDLPGALGFRVGRHVRFRPSDLDAWIDQSMRNREA